VTDNWELGDPASSSTTSWGSGIGMSPSVEGGVTDVGSGPQGGVMVALGVTSDPECWSFCWAAFFFKLSLKHLEHMPSKLAFPKKPHPWVHSELSSLSIGVAALQQPTPN